MSLRNILNAAATIAGASANGAKVYKHLLWAVTDADVTAKFMDNQNRMNTIMITREATDSQDEGPNSNYDYHNLVLRWYRAMQRAADDSTNSEDAFQDDVEALRLAFN